MLHLSLSLTLVALCSLPLFSQEGRKEGTVREALTLPSMGFQKGITAFGLDLYQQLKKNKGNLIFSPTSIAGTLAMCSAGAKGKTETELYTVLHQTPSTPSLHVDFNLFEKSLHGPLNSGCEITWVNSLWLDRSFQAMDAFQKQLTQFYQTQPRTFDSTKPTESAQQINAWVKDATKSRIAGLIQPSHIRPRLTRLALLNAIAFKGQWASAFDGRCTQEKPFRLSTKKSATVPTMSRIGKYAYAETPELTLVELPYRDSSLTFIIILPRETEGLANLEKSFTLVNLEKWLALKEEQEVELQLPKLKLRSSASLEPSLQSLGLKTAFSPRADFSGISKEPLAIDKVLHGAFMEMDEQGTEAAAATAVTMTRKAPSPPKTLKADHPFLFMIRDNQSGGLLFLGRVTDPR